MRSDGPQVEPIRDSIKGLNGVAEFSRAAFAIALAIGVPAFVSAAIATAFVVEYSVSSDVILAFRGHVIGGGGDIAVAVVLAVSFGAVGIACLLRLLTELRVWREKSIGCQIIIQTMVGMWTHACLLIDIWSMKLFVWMLGRNGELLDSHLFFFDRYSDLADYHRGKGRTARAEKLAAIAETYYQAAPDDDEPPAAAAMAMPVPRPPIKTNAVSTMRITKPPSGRPSDFRPSPAS